MQESRARLGSPAGGPPCRISKMIDDRSDTKLVGRQASTVPPEPATAGLRLLVMIPALNESATIADVIDRIPRELSGIKTIEVIVVDDGSSDQTAQIAIQSGARVVSHSRNMGVGKAIQTGLAEAVRHSVDIAVNIDADGQFAPEDIPKLVHPIILGEADFVSASRFKDPTVLPEMPRIKLFGNKGMSWLISYLTGERYYDVSCGFRAYSREALLHLTLMGCFTYTQETFLALNYHGLRLVEVPITVRGEREHGESRVASNLTRYTLQTSWIIIGFLRDYRPSIFFNTIAHALLIPGILLAMFFFGHHAVTGTFTPHLWSGFLAAYLTGLAILLYVFGQLASMFTRLRMLHEETLYHQRRMSVETEHRRQHN